MPDPDHRSLPSWHVRAFRPAGAGARARAAALAALLTLAAASAPARAADPAAPSPGPLPAESLAGLSFDGLTPAQKTLALAILNESGCDCSCSMTVAVCRRDDSKCTRSLALGNQVISLVKQGKDRAEIAKLVFNPPSKYVQFPVTPGTSPSRGPAGARVTIIHYTDYQCPFCQKVEPTLARILREYPQDVRIVYKMHPLPMHANAPLAAEAALAAAAQGKFFEMHDRLFAAPQAISRDSVLAAAGELGLDVPRFTKDLDGHAWQAAVARDTKEAVDLGATGTPASFVNGRYLSGAKPFEAFKAIIDEELAWAKAGNRPAFTTGMNVREASAKQAAPAPADPEKIYALNVGSAPSRGPAGARVTVLHFLDYQCPFCVRVAPTIDRLLAEYPEDVRLVVKMHPLPMHAQAMVAAEAALAAGSQGRFFEMHEKLLANSSALSREKVLELASGLGLDMPKFTAELDGHVHRSAIDTQTSEVTMVGATATPATFVNGHLVSGAQPYEAFKKIVDAELARIPKTAARP